MKHTCKNCQRECGHTDQTLSPEVIALIRAAEDHIRSLKIKYNVKGSANRLEKTLEAFR